MNESFDIDFIINSLARGGAERVCVNLANFMFAKGYRIRITVLRDVENNYEEDIDSGICINHLKAKKDIFGLIKLKSFLKSSNIKKILAFDERITSICNYIKIKKHKNYYIITRVINNVDFQERQNKKIIYKLLYKFSKKYFRYSNKYIFQCKAMMERMTNYFNLSKEKSEMTYIYNPLSKRFYNIPINKYKDDFFLMVGRLDEQKGYEYVLKSLIECKNKGMKIHLKILGDGPLKNKLKDMVRINKLDVDFLGNVKNVIDYYSKAKALILTSIYEGFPNVLIEGLACGCPLISFDCPTGPSEIIDNSNGILIKYLDVEELTNCLINFNNKKWNYDEIAQSSNRYKDESTLEKYAKELGVEKYD